MTWLSRFLLIPLLCASTAASAQHLGQPDSGGVGLWRVVGALLFCLVLAGAAAFLLRQRFGGQALFHRNTAGRLKLIEQIHIGPQQGISLVEIDGQDYAIITSPQGADWIPLDARDNHDDLAVSEDDA